MALELQKIHRDFVDGSHILHYNGVLVRLLHYECRPAWRC
jgi:hypothetical protein